MVVSSVGRLIDKIPVSNYSQDSTKMSSTLVLLALFLHITAYPQYCTLIHDHLLYWSIVNQTSFNMTAYIAGGNNGWGGISLHAGSQWKETSMYLVIGGLKPNVAVGEYKVDGETIVFKQNANGTAKEQAFFLEQDFLILEYMISMELLANVTHLSVLMNYDEKIENSKIGQPTNVVTRELDLFNENLIYGSRNNCRNRRNANLIETHWAFSVFELTFSLVLVLLCILLRNKQPLKSRRLVPIMNTSAHFIRSTVITLYLCFDLEFNMKYTCTLFYLIGDPLSCMCVGLLPIYFFNYLLIVNFNKKKDLASQTNVGDRFKKYVKIVRWMSSNWMFLIMCALVALANLITTLSIMAAYGFDCKNSGQQNMIRVGVSAIFTVICVIGLVICLYDIISNWSSLRKCRLKALFSANEDPFMFRPQLILNLWLVFYFAVWGLLTILGVFSLAPGSFVYALFTTFLYYIVWFNQTIFPVSLTIIQQIKIKLKAPTIASSEIEIHLKNSEVYEMFLQFAKSEWSSENVLLWKDIIKFKSKSADLRAQAEMIYNKYLDQSSVLEVNLPSGVSDRVKQKLTSGKIDNTLFDEVYEGVVMNLKDTFTRFSLSKQWTAYVQKQDQRDMLLKEGHLK